ncbi:hypothetical protein D0Y65_003233 [Glycine soja]|uniref:WPP domain-associated protein n=1 Tax=Glycine soja TaxID=3848 RepID=A0A445LKR0_GLYSO|nr:hypothetical protein D0Y65_003233 [Glycine soja]
MDGIFECIDGRFEVSLADSTMMGIVHHAMNKAQEKMKLKTGVIEQLNEISKFYELAVMQLEGCLSIVHTETESSFLESNHEEDKELAERLENELQLRHALELKERQLVSLGISHGIETSSLNAENDQTTRKEHDNGDGDGDGNVCELRTSVDQSKLEAQHDMLSEVQNNGIGRIKVEEMGSDIDILKQTMDLAFGKMQSALFLCEMRPKEREWKLTIEKDVMSISIGSFMRDFQENIEVKVKREENQDSDCSSLSSPAKPSSPTKPSSPEGNHEIPNRFSLKMETDKSPEEEENEDGSSMYVAKLIKNHESIIRRKSEELNLSKHVISQERKASYVRRRKELNRMRERIHVVTEKLGNFIRRNAKLIESLFNQRSIHDAELFPRRKLSEVDEIHTIKDVESQRRAEKQVEVLDSKSYNFDLEKKIQECVYKYYLREVISEWNENIEMQTIERKSRDDINLIVLSEAVMDISANQEFSLIKGRGSEAEESCLQCLTCSDQIHYIVLGETLKNVVNYASFASTERENRIQNDFLGQLQFITIENILKEDVCMVVFKAMVKEWKLELDNYYMENYIRENINQVVMVWTLNDAFLLTIEDSCSTSTMMLNQVRKVHGEENLKILLLESLLGCFEAEESLMPSAKCEIKEQCRELDLGSE